MLFFLYLHIFIQRKLSCTRGGIFEQDRGALHPSRRVSRVPLRAAQPGVRDAECAQAASDSPVGLYPVKLHTPGTNGVARPSSPKSVAPRAEAAVCGLDP